MAPIGIERARAKAARWVIFTGSALAILGGTMAVGRADERLTVVERKADDAVTARAVVVERLDDTRDKVVRSLSMVEAMREDVTEVKQLLREAINAIEELRDARR